MPFYFFEKLHVVVNCESFGEDLNLQNKVIVLKYSK